MKPRQILIVAAALVVVVVLLLVFGRPRTSSQGVDALMDQLVVPGFVPKDARLIELTKAGSDTVRVRQADDGWTVESAWGYEADATRVAGLLSAIEAMRIRDVRSTRVASHPDFQLDDAGGIWVRVYDRNDTEIAVFCVGKAISYDRCFVRRADSDAVLEATVNLLYLLGATGRDGVPNPVSFVDKNVVRFNPADVRTVTLERDGETVVLAKVEEVVLAKAEEVVLAKAEAEEPGVDPGTGEDATTTATKWVIREPQEEADRDVEEADRDVEKADEDVGEADGDVCEEIVSGFSSTVATDIGGARTVGECGLAPPQARVTIEFSEESGTEPVTILFGTKGPKGKRYYVVRGEEGARIFLVSSYYRYLARRDLNELRKVKREPSPDEPTEEPTTEPADHPADGPADETGAAPTESP